MTSVIKRFISHHGISKRQQLSWTLYLSGFLDLCAVGMIFTQIPSQIRSSGASTTLTGIIGSIYGGIQFFSSPIVGKWSDSANRKSSILLILLISGIGYSMMALSASIYLMLVSRIILGVFKHGQTLSRAYLADVSSEKERSAVMGRFNSFSSIGFVVGPIVGGHLAETSGGFHLVAACTACIFILNAAMLWMFAPPSDLMKQHVSLQSGNKQELESLLINGEVRKEKEVGQDENEKALSDNEQRGSFILLAFWDLFLIVFFGSVSMIIYRTNFSLLLREKFLVSPKTLGYITSYTGLVSTFSGFFVGKITDRYKNNDAKLFLHVTMVQVFVLLGLSLSPSIPFILFFLTPLSVITTIARVTTTTITIQRCGKDKTASVMGWSQSVVSVARMMAPFMVGVAQEWSMDVACYFSVLGITISLVLMVVFPQGSSQNSHKRDN